jgi:hypothetical protein
MVPVFKEISCNSVLPEANMIKIENLPLHYYFEGFFLVSLFLLT